MEGTANSHQPQTLNDSGIKQGLTQRAVADLFKQVKRVRETTPHQSTGIKGTSSTKHVNVFCSFLQIYNEKVFDLLNPESTPDMLRAGRDGDDDGRKGSLQNQGLRIRWTKKEQFIVENLFVFECQTSEDALSLFSMGLRNKVVAAHNLNH